MSAFQSHGLASWTADPEQHPNWPQVYANALGALLKANSRRKEALGDMTVDDWRTVVQREMQADLWYEEPEPHQEAIAVEHIDRDLTRRTGHRPKVIASAV